MKIEVNIEKKYAFLIFAAFIVLIGVLAVWAYSGGYPNTLDPVPAAFQNNRPAYVGHTPDEIYDLSGMINNSARQISEELLADYMGLNCPEEPVYDSLNVAGGYANKDVRKAITIPAICWGNGGCYVRQEIYNGNNLRIARGFLYRQYKEKIGNKDYWYWTNPKNPTVKVYNGIDPRYNKVYRNYLFPIFYSSTDYRVALSDDYSAIDLANNQWSGLDLSDKWAMKIYICDPSNQVSFDFGD